MMEDEENTVDSFHRHKFKHRTAAQASSSSSLIENEKDQNENETEFKREMDSMEIDASAEAQENTAMDAPETAPPKESFQEEAPEEELYCICRKPFDEKRFMIGCDGGCEQWFHGDCVGISEAESNRVDVFICADCEREKNLKTVWKTKCFRAKCKRYFKSGGTSKYCSDECGIEVARARLFKAFTEPALETGSTGLQFEYENVTNAAIEKVEKQKEDLESRMRRLLDNESFFGCLIPLLGCIGSYLQSTDEITPPICGFYRPLLQNNELFELEKLYAQINEIVETGSDQATRFNQLFCLESREKCPEHKHTNMPKSSLSPFQVDQALLSPKLIPFLSQSKQTTPAWLHLYARKNELKIFEMEIQLDQCTRLLQGLYSQNPVDAKTRARIVVKDRPFCDVTLSCPDPVGQTQITASITIRPES